MTVASPRHFGVVVNDLDASLAFYQGVLGLVPVRRMEERGPFVETILALPGVDLTTVKLAAEEGGVQIELLRFHSHPDTEGRETPPYRRGPTHMAFTVADIEALCRRIAAMGLPLLSLPAISEDGRAKVAFCRDPDGGLVELVEMLAAVKPSGQAE